MKKIDSIDSLVKHVTSDSSLPIQLNITGPNSFSLIGVASSRESLFGAISKLVNARQYSEIPTFTGEQELLERLHSWEGSGGGFSGGGASGTW